MDIIGVKANGRNGVLSCTELRDLILTRAVGGTNAGNANQCAAYIQGHNGTTTGGGTTYTFHGRQVFHISHGLASRGDGCSVFFAQTGQAGIGTIVAVGQHHAGTSYRLNWVRSGWHVGILQL